VLRPRHAVHYPSSDGLPMADNDASRTQMENIEFALKNWFKSDPKVYVTANFLVYYVEGDKRKVVAPDVFLVRDVPNHQRDTYLVWEEGKTPDVVFEFTSRSSKHLDPRVKVPIYHAMGVPEVYLFDPEGKWVTPRFRALRHTPSGYQDVLTAGSVCSPVLGLELRMVGDELRLYDPHGNLLPTGLEEAERAQQAEQRAEEAEQRANNARLAALQDMARKMLVSGYGREEVQRLTGLEADEL
jgi:Uma2 family endonuclease